MHFTTLANALLAALASARPNMHHGHKHGGPRHLLPSQGPIVGQVNHTAPNPTTGGTVSSTAHLPTGTLNARGLRPGCPSKEFCDFYPGGVPDNLDPRPPQPIPTTHHEEKRQVGTPTVEQEEAAISHPVYPRPHMPTPTTLLTTHREEKRATHTPEVVIVTLDHGPKSASGEFSLLCEMIRGVAVIG
ncbi:MAG: hypothetical protein Q9166_004544 [cf. Caloplaca sp. 2 TL-2023]